MDKVPGRMLVDMVIDLGVWRWLKSKRKNAPTMDYYVPILID